MQSGGGGFIVPLCCCKLHTGSLRTEAAPPDTTPNRAVCLPVPSTTGLHLREQLHLARKLAAAPLAALAHAQQVEQARHVALGVVEQAGGGAPVAPCSNTGARPRAGAMRRLTQVQRGCTREERARARVRPPPTHLPYPPPPVQAAAPYYSVPARPPCPALHRPHASCGTVHAPARPASW